MSFLAPDFEKEPAVPAEEEAAPQFGVVLIQNAGRLILLNLLFLACCLPVVTIGPAMAGLYRAVMGLVRGTSEQVVHEFLHGMRRYWKQGIGLTLAGGIFAVCTVRTLLVYWTRGGMLEQVLFVLTLVVVFGLLLAAQYIFPLLTEVDLPFWTHCRNAFVLGLLCVRQSLPCALFLLLFYGLGLWYFPLTLPILLLVGWSVPAFVVGWSAWKGITQYVAAAEPAVG